MEDRLYKIAAAVLVLALIIIMLYYGFRGTFGGDPEIEALIEALEA